MIKYSALCSLLFTLIFTSCSSSKKYTKKKTRKPNRVVLKSPNMIPNTQHPKLTQNTKINKGLVVRPINTENYIKRFYRIAVQEMKTYKIPASITLAQGILESGSGRSDLAIRSNNHFGIKCHKGWEGKSVTHDDDEIAECFRKYVHPETSYEDHSQFLIGRKRYAKLFKLKPTDYVRWAYGLKKAGYATDPRYPKKLIALIKRYKLYQYDQFNETSTVNIEQEKPITETPTKNNKPLYIVAKGDTLYSISRKNNLSIDQLKTLNDLKDNELSIGQILKLN